MTYLLNNLEAFSQLVNTIHGGNPNTTFSARLGLIRDGSEDYWIIHRYYWHTLVYLFETFWPGHLDWALEPDE